MSAAASRNSIQDDPYSVAALATTAKPPPPPGRYTQRSREMRPCALIPVQRLMRPASDLFKAGQRIRDLLIGLQGGIGDIVMGKRKVIPVLRLITGLVGT